MWILDSVDTVLRRRLRFVPPRREIEKIGGHDFLAVGEQLAGIARVLGGLRAHERVLDIGCGVGRLAVALRNLLDLGEYAGFDVHRTGIAWCRQAIEQSQPNFHFSLVDVRNRHYNPGGAILPEKFVFPYASSSVDLAFASSVFTHLSPPAADRYLSEIGRVLKPGGRFVGSFFLLNPETRAVMARTSPSFLPVDWYYAVENPEDIEAAIAFDERGVRDALERHGIPLKKIEYGGWAMRPQGLSFQDFVLAVKT